MFTCLQLTLYAFTYPVQGQIFLRNGNRGGVCNAAIWNTVSTVVCCPRQTDDDNNKN
jgi:hypothetical protein